MLIQYSAEFYSEARPALYSLKSLTLQKNMERKLIYHTLSFALWNESGY